MSKLTNNLLILLLLGLMLAPMAFAGRKVAKTGKVAGGVYTDAKYGFTIDMNEEWRSKTSKAKSPMRLILSQKKFSVPADYQDAPDYTMAPRIVVYADTTSMSVDAFIDSLINDSYQSEQKKQVLKEFEILSKQELIPRGKKKFKINERKAYTWKARANYTTEVATSSSAIGGKRVYGSYGGAIIGVKKDDLIIIFHVICEYEYFNDIYMKTMRFAHTIKWADTED